MMGAEGIKLSLEMHLRAQEQLKMSLKNVSAMKNIFERSHDVVLKLHENRNQTYGLYETKLMISWSLLVPV